MHASGRHSHTGIERLTISTFYFVIKSNYFIQFREHRSMHEQDEREFHPEFPHIYVFDLRPRLLPRHLLWTLRENFEPMLYANGRGNKQNDN